MSVSPLQNFSKPPPVPEVPTVTLTPGLLAKSSAATEESGATVEEPSTRTSPVRSALAPEPESLLLPPQAVSRRMGAVSAAAAQMRVLPMVVLFFVRGCARCVLTRRTVGTHFDAQGGPK